MHPADSPPHAAAARTKGAYWPWLLAGLLLASVATQVSLLMAATSDPAFAVEPDYYGQASRWDEHMAQERENARLGWRADVLPLGAPRPDGRVDLAARLVDAEGNPLQDATVSVTAFFNARAAVRHEGVMAPVAGEPGVYAAAFPLRRAGLWEIELRAVRGDRTFTARIRRDLSPPPQGAAR